MGRVVVRQDDDPSVRALADLRILQLVELALGAGWHIEFHLVKSNVLHFNSITFTSKTTSGKTKN
jgi:hypothetical protein